VNSHASNRSAGFTLAELIIGVLLSTIVMGAVLNSYVFVARAYTRTIGFGLPNQPTLESQGRRTLAYFAQDVQATAGINESYTLADHEVTLTMPRSTGGTRDVTYYYNETANAISLYGVSVPANTLVRIDRSTSTLLTLHSSLLTCVITYYDTFGRPYTTYTNAQKGIKQIALALTAQAGTSANRTLTSVYTVASPRLVLRNKSLLP